MDGFIEELPGWMKAMIAVGTGTIVGILTAKLIMIIGT
jgi:hypothetical protein